MGSSGAGRNPKFMLISWSKSKKPNPGDCAVERRTGYRAALLQLLSQKGIDCSASSRPQKRDRARSIEQRRPSALRSPQAGRCRSISARYRPRNSSPMNELAKPLRAICHRSASVKSSAPCIAAKFALM